MRTQHLVTFYKIGKPSSTCVCTRSYKSTRKFAFKHLFTDGVIFFKIKLSNEKSTKTT